MEEKIKKIIIEEECCGEGKHHNKHSYEGRPEKEMHKHFKKEFKDSFHKEFKKHRRHKPFVHIMNDKKVKQTKLFDSKKDLVSFVNQVGEDGTEVDIFKIEEGLYKVVVFKREE